MSCRNTAPSPRWHGKPPAGRAQPHAPGPFSSPMTDQQEDRRPVQSQRPQYELNRYGRTGHGILSVSRVPAAEWRNRPAARRNPNRPATPPATGIAPRPFRPLPGPEGAHWRHLRRSRMIALLACTALLLAGYFTHSRVVDRLFFGPDVHRPTPALSSPRRRGHPAHAHLEGLSDPVAGHGIGPIFGPILGALYGPVALVWIVLGNFAGGVHYFQRHAVLSATTALAKPEVVGRTMGEPCPLDHALLFGAAAGAWPAWCSPSAPPTCSGRSSAWIRPPWSPPSFSITSRHHPAGGQNHRPLLSALRPAAALHDPRGDRRHLLERRNVPGADTLLRLPSEVHPEGLPVWPLLFITPSCGAISGFHSTQSPPHGPLSPPPNAMAAACSTAPWFAKALSLQPATAA